MSRKLLIRIVAVIVVLFVLLQLVSFVVPAFARTNPAVTYQVQWSSPEAEALARTACYDCHSNDTQWPWYGYIAPVSWLVAKDVNEAREVFNFSTGEGEFEADEMIDEIREGGMPLPNYVSMHPDAKLTDAQKQTLIDGIEASIHENPAGAGGEENEGDNDDD